MYVDVAEVGIKIVFQCSGVNCVTVRVGHAYNLMGVELVSKSDESDVQVGELQEDRVMEAKEGQDFKKKNMVSCIKSG